MNGGPHSGIETESRFQPTGSLMASVLIEEECRPRKQKTFIRAAIRIGFATAFSKPRPAGEC
jgi:hypothetical protein